MPDPFDTDYVNLISPVVFHYAIVPSDGSDLQVRPRAIYVNATGTAVLQDKDGVAVSYEVVAGMVMSIRPARVLSTGTTAQLVAWY